MLKKRLDLVKDVFIFHRLKHFDMLCKIKATNKAQPHTFRSETSLHECKGNDELFLHEITFLDLCMGYFIPVSDPGM